MTFERTLFYAIQTAILRIGERATPQIRVKDLNSIPVYLCDENIEGSIVKLVDEIIALKRQNHDTTALEQKIDVLVYKLYALTYEEVLVIEPEFLLSAAEYAGVEV
jgi:hypothetical protein